MVAGCVIITNWQELSTLKTLVASQREIEKDLAEKETLFYQLKKNIQNNRLRKGIAQRAILVRYGEPVLSKKTKGRKIAQEVFLG